MKRIAVSISEAADLLGAHPQTVRRWVREGRIPHRRLGTKLFIPTQFLVEQFGGCDFDGKHKT